jgi:hypothetical protein
MATARKPSSHMHAVGKWSKEKAIVLLKREQNGFAGPPAPVLLDNGYVLAVRDSIRYLFSVEGRDRLQEIGKPNLSFNVYPDKVMAAAHEIGAIPAWLTIPINREKCMFSAFWGLITQLPRGRSGRYAIGVPMKNTAFYPSLARDEADEEIINIFAGKR